ncbi:MAG: serine/threonine protein kinase [Labilithrix sp.]|nr:serine/threonine protein kinase [Labilithrix sp.]
MVEVGQVISGKYKLLRLLGDGGMGAVYEAEHLTLGTHVAIKVLHSDLARRAGIAERFLQEARVSAQIRSPHVVQVIDVDRTADDVAYLVMELLQGEPLSGVVKRQQKLAVGTACEYAGQILQALEAAHALGVIHRDLKPDNVFVTFQGGKSILKLIDFGIAKLKTAQAGQTKNLTVAGMLMGTPEYMAPEQAYSADKVDVRADLYAVGVMLYEMLSGQAPATADDPRVLILKVERGEVTPLVQAAPGIEPQLAGFVHRAMAPRPELRFANATEMRLALEDIASGKRAGTAKIAAAGGGGGTAPVAAPLAPPAAAPPAAAAPAIGAALADTSDARPDIGTGTVMGAPVDAALTNPAAGSGPPPPMGHGSGGTVGAPPLAAPAMTAPHAGAHHAPPHAAGPHAPAYEPTRPPPKKGGSGLIIALAVIALLLGAGAVVAYVLGTQEPTPVPLPPPTFATETPTPSTPLTPPATSTVTPVTPLTTSTVVPTAPPPPGPSPTPAPKKDAGGGGQAQQDAGGGGGGQPAADAGTPGQTTIVTPFGTFQFPGPRPPFYPPDQPWPPPNLGPFPSPPQ